MRRRVLLSFERVLLMESNMRNLREVSMMREFL